MSAATPCLNKVISPEKVRIELVVEKAIPEKSPLPAIAVNVLLKFRVELVAKKAPPLFPSVPSAPAEPVHTWLPFIVVAATES